ncbi:RND family transporter [Halovenus rubra]|uniref:RND family transporter n=2 Tax=Halovenus rubra TaxID=869890 RepID=A0ACC7E2D6_9EURY|nr:MMPL family transporter [Halovenus rubra]
MIRQILQRTTTFVSKHNWVTLLVMLVLTGLVVAGIPQLDFGNQVGGSADEFDNLDRVETSQYIDEHYGNDTAKQTERVIEPVYVERKNGTALSKESLLTGLRYQQEITDSEAVRTALHDDGVVGIENLVATRAAGTQNATVDEQIRAIENTSAAGVEQLVGQTIAEDPIAQRFLPTDHDSSASSTDRRIFVAIDTSVDDETLDTVDTTLYDTANKYSDSGFFVATDDAFGEMRSQFNSEMLELVVPVALLLILSILVFTYRDIVDVTVGMSGVVLSILWMLGIMGWLGVQASTITVVPVVLITGLSIDFGFHVFNRYREERGPDDGIRSPMERGIRFVSTALILVTVTASIGFLANLANPLPVIQDLGVSITLGVISALAIFVTIVPALKISIDGLLEWIGLDRRKAVLGRGSYLRPALELSVSLARRAAPVVLVVSVLIAGAGGLAWTELSQESFQQGNGDVAEWKQQLPDPVAWEPVEFRQQLLRTEEVYQPANADDAAQSTILVDGNVTADSTLEDIDRGVADIEEEGLLVTQSSGQAEQSPTTAMARIAKENETFATVLSQADTNGNGVPDQNLEAVYDAFYAADSQTAAQVIERTDGEYRTVLVTLALDAEHSDRKAVVSQLDDGAATMQGNSQRTATAAGSFGVGSAILDEIVGGIFLTMIIALLAIIVTLVAVFRYMHGSATLGAVTALPITLVVGLVVGGMYLLEIPLTLLTALLMSLVVGLGVDYNIHIGDRFADELAAGKKPLAALRVAVTGTGGALLGSTLTTVGAFGSIWLVPHPQMQSFGGIVVIALLTAFIVSLVVLPSALLLWSRHATVPETSSQVTLDPAPQD